MIRYVLMDIEGTTTPITFVHDVLFPYSAARLSEYVKTRSADPAVRQCLNETQETVKIETGLTIDDQGAITQLLTWIEDDRKHPALKKLQGMIWRYGYEEKAYTAQIYEDVPPQLRTWRAEGLQLGIYSSGSVEAQRLLFRHTQHGDLTPLLSHYFDTAVGGKREASAYHRIVDALQLPANRILFLSDIPEELDAAAAVSLQTCQLIRPGTHAAGRHRQASDFYAVDHLIKDQAKHKES